MIINAFNIDTSAKSSNVAVSKTYQVIGDAGAIFHMIVIDNSGNYYNFPENTVVDLEQSVFQPAPAFSSTAANLFNKQIPATGVYNGVIIFPTGGGDKNFRVIVTAGNNTSFDEQTFSNKNIFISEKINQYAGTAVTFTVTHSSSAVVEPSSIVFKGESSEANAMTTSVKQVINWPFTLSSSAATILRQPQLNDFEFTTTRTTPSIRTTTGSTTSIELTDVAGLSKGMNVKDAEDTDLGKITKIISGFKDFQNSTGSNPIYRLPVKINDDGDDVVNSTAGTIVVENAINWGVSGTLTFTGKGSTGSETFNKTSFLVKNFKIELDDVVTTTTAAVPDTVVHCTSANGIKAQAQYTVNGNRTSNRIVLVDEVITDVCIGQRLQAMSSGTLVGIPTVVAVDTANKLITLSSPQTFVNDATLTFSNSIVKGIGVKNATTDPYVVSISTNDVTVNANQDIESGATVTFVGSSRAGKISGEIELLEYGDDSITLDLNFDNILKVV